jgi:hypothetical protein
VGDTWRDVCEVGAISPVEPDDRNAGRSERREDASNRFDGGGSGTHVHTDRVEPSTLGAEVVLHVDNDDRRSGQIDGQSLRESIEFDYNGRRPGDSRASQINV